MTTKFYSRDATFAATFNRRLKPAQIRHSLRLIEWARDNHLLTPLGHSIGKYLFNFARQSIVCPARETIGGAVKCSLATVDRAMGVLVAIGLIEKHHRVRHVGGTTIPDTNCYRLLCPWRLRVWLQSEQPEPENPEFSTKSGASAFCNEPQNEADKGLLRDIENAERGFGVENPELQPPPRPTITQAIARKAEKARERLRKAAGWIAKGFRKPPQSIAEMDAEMFASADRQLRALGFG